MKNCLFHGMSLLKGILASALLRNIRNIRICMGKKPIVSVTYENERISIKKQFTLHKMCVTSLPCGPCGNYCKRFIERENRSHKNP